LGYENYHLARAKKQLKSIGRAAQIILVKKIGELTIFQIKEEKLSGYRNMYRVRVGDYRLIYQKTSVEIYVILVGHRREVYRLLRGLLR